MSCDHDHLMKTEQIFDDFQGKDQAVINCEVYNKLKSLEDFKGEDYVIVDSLPSKPSAGDEDKIYLVPTEEEDVYDSYKWDQRVAGWASQGQIKVPDSAIVLTKEEGDKFYQKKLIPGAGISIDEDGNISVTANTDVFKPVASLPDTPAEEDKSKIFLVENSSEEEGNLYDEYIWAVNDENPDGYWEKIGSTKIDLSAYLTKEEAAEKYQPIAPQGDPYVKKSELEGIDGNSIPWRISLPIRTPLNKVFEESEILEWFRVESVTELKQLFNTRNLYLRYGIILTGKPMYYNMQIHYAAFESDTQVKLIWIGLDTSNDVATKYTFIINLNGAAIENNSNVSLKLESLASSESQDSYVVVDELTEDYIVPANPEKKEISYEIHVGSEVHNISAAEGVKWQNNSAPEVQADHIYVVSVINNLAVWGEF